ncbi:hypothetical protein CR194_06635 [Salipaludibacillus keqinensis]|uniref:Uncharacterized protein n=1 Tax=Salipaludibacillus keqinensis TaxID=2045207 RepID=A0A323TNC2_9BACI|nr:hypothetical protein [Salipaludibacillus keqinensis]PYZ95187.1 hypothetical protein CR194_06635 [Salipaludibacillus keqinensis]
MPYIRIIMTAIAKILSKFFSMATLTFFGRIPTQDSSVMSFMGIVSLYWIYIAISVFFPDLAEMFIPFIPDDETIIRIVSISLAVLLPLAVGYASTKIENRDPDYSILKQMVMGYPYALVLGSLSMLLVIIIPLIKLPSIIKMHTQEQFAVMIRKGKYDDVLEEIKTILSDYDLPAHIHDPKKPVWYCFIALSYVLEHIFNKKIAKKMKYLTVEVEDTSVEVTLHATDISIVGSKKEVLQVKHILSEEIEPENLFFSWDDSTQKIEEEICEMKHQLEDGEQIDFDELKDITEKLRKSSLANEDWNAIRRQIYKLERDNYKNECESKKSYQ